MKRSNSHYLYRLSGKFLVAMALMIGVASAQETDNVCTDCAELGRIAVAKQLEAIKAAQLVPKIADMLAEADWLAKSARTDYNIADTAAHFAADAKDATDKAQQQAIHDKFEARAKDEVQKSVDLRKQAETAKADADRLAQEAKDALDKYHDCLKHVRCPGATKKLPPGYSNCPAAQDFLERANLHHEWADQDNNRANQAEAGGDAAGAARYRMDARSEESSAHSLEDEAARALLRCDEKEQAQAPPADGPGATDTGTVQPGYQPQVVGGPQPQPEVPKPEPGAAIPLPHDKVVKSELEVDNFCSEPHTVKVHTEGLPASMVEVPTFTTNGAGSQTVPITYNTKGVNPGGYEGKLIAECVDCNPPCFQNRRIFDIKFYVQGEPEYDPDGETDQIRKVHQDRSQATADLAKALRDRWGGNDDDPLSQVQGALYDQTHGDPVGHAQSQITRSSWQIEIYQESYIRGRKAGLTNLAAHAYAQIQVDKWKDASREDFEQAFGTHYAALGQAIALDPLGGVNKAVEQAGGALVNEATQNTEKARTIAREIEKQRVGQTPTPQTLGVDVAEEAANGQPTARAVEPTVRREAWGDYRANYGSDPNAVTFFKKTDDGGVAIDYVNRGAQPKGTGGQMVADALREARIEQPPSITLNNVLNQPTLDALANGVAPGETVLGKMTAATAKELGGRVTGWEMWHQGGKLYMRAKLAY